MNPEYLISKENESMIGKRAKILKIETYCEFLYGQKGTIEDAHGNLFLKFDKPAKRHKDDWMPMNGVYLTLHAFELLENLEEEKFCDCGNELRSEEDLTSNVCGDCR